MTEYFALPEEGPTMTIQEFIGKYGIAIGYSRVSANPNMANDQWAKEASHYLVSLSIMREGTPFCMTVPYNMGKAHKDGPTPADVLSALALDALGVHGGREFEDWAQEYGYDADSRKAETTFETVCKQAQELQRFLGDEAYQELLFEVDTE
jgi:hypothetical protein